MNPMINKAQMYLATGSRQVPKYENPLQNMTAKNDEPCESKQEIEDVEELPHSIEALQLRVHASHDSDNEEEDDECEHDV